MHMTECISKQEMWTVLPSVQTFLSLFFRPNFLSTSCLWTFLLIPSHFTILFLSVSSSSSLSLFLVFVNLQTSFDWERKIDADPWTGKLIFLSSYFFPPLSLFVSVSSSSHFITENSFPIRTGESDSSNFSLSTLSLSHSVYLRETFSPLHQV